MQTYTTVLVLYMNTYTIVLFLYMYTNTKDLSDQIKMYAVYMYKYIRVAFLLYIQQRGAK